MLLAQQRGIAIDCTLVPEKTKKAFDALEAE